MAGKKKTAGKDADKAAPPGKKKKSLLKRLIFLVLILVAIGGSAFVVHRLYFKETDPAKIYKTRTLTHVGLPEEIIRFTFDHFKDLYFLFLLYNEEMNLLESEIARIDDVGRQYPDQEKIALKEKAVWEKTKSALSKEFAKIEKPIRETYVLHQVNSEQGLTRISETAEELTAAAGQALAGAKPLTEKIRSKQPEPPEGMIQGALYKIKQKLP